MSELVSVIILSYNQSEYLADAIESVINQTYQLWELIIIDNGSTDNSQQLLQQYSRHPKIRLVLHNENDHITKRCNEGIRLARGEYISILYSDDYYLPDKLEKQIACIAHLPSEWGVVHGPSYGVTVSTGKKTIMCCINSSGYIMKDIFTRFFDGFINPITPLIRRECLERYPFYEDLFTEGEGIFLKIAMSYKFYYLDEPLAVMREHYRNMRFASKRNAEITAATLDKLEKHKDLPADCLKDLRTFRGRILRNYAWQDVRFGNDRKWALNMFIKAVHADWRQAFHPKTVIGFFLTAFMPQLIITKLRKLIDNYKQDKVIYLEDYYR